LESELEQPGRENAELPASANQSRTIAKMRSSGNWKGKPSSSNPKNRYGVEPVESLQSKLELYDEAQRRLGDE
jgi:hypothetical protein